jgi:hypothetical protein
VARFEKKFGKKELSILTLPEMTVKSGLNQGHGWIIGGIACHGWPLIPEWRLG